MGKIGSNVNDMANEIIIEAIAPPAEFRTSYDQLKPTERVFVDAYVALDEPIGAAFAAFPELANMGKSDKRAVSAAGARALEMSRRPMVQAAIAEKMAAAAARWDLTADKVLAEIAKIAYSNMDDYTKIVDGQRVIDIVDVPRDLMAAVSEITVEEYKEGRGEDAREVIKTKFKLHDKQAALDKAMKYLGLYSPEKLAVAVAGRVTHTTEAGAPLAITHNMSDADAAELYRASLNDDA